MLATLSRPSADSLTRAINDFNHSTNNASLLVILLNHKIVQFASTPVYKLFDCNYSRHTFIRFYRCGKVVVFYVHKMMSKVLQ